MNQRLKWSLLAGPRSRVVAPEKLDETPQKPAQRLSEAEQVAQQIRPNVYEVVGGAWATYMLAGGSEGVVEAISEAITHKLATNPEFFFGGGE